ncbi:III [Bovine adenovirus 10]|uniref:Penton protein n=1 Tax=Bovine adenovirus C serotype 10 TaxID=39788 RepID=A0A9X9KQ71_ADEBA|nr:III [Bovine adenovirus 10]
MDQFQTRVDPITLEEPYVPPRYQSATEGRNSIIYSQLPPLYDTTKLYLIDNKSADINSLNYQNNHSDFLTSVVQNTDYTPIEASTQHINFDNRSRWGGELKTMLHTNLPNITEFMFSNSFRIKTMVSHQEDEKIYEWAELKIPEGNYSEMTVIDLMNNAILDHYLRVCKPNGVKEDEIGVKIDTRNFRLGWDPSTQLVMPGRYTHEAFHPDIVLLPGCGIDFTYSRLNNLLGIRKRYPFQEGFKIEYEDLIGGNIPALLDVAVYNPDTNTNIQPLLKDIYNFSYHVNEAGSGPNNTAYRSWYLAYNYGDPKNIKSTTLLTTPDVTCGVEQVYWSLPDLAVEPVTFKASQNPSNYPVIGTELFPLWSRSFFNAAAVYAQMVQETTNRTHIFNPFPYNQILLRPPASTITSISENVPSFSDHGIVPIKNNISGVQRVTLTDARRRICPYVYKSLGILTPKVISSRTF